MGSPSRFSPLLDLEQEVEDLEKQYEEDTNHVVEEIEEGELVEKKEVQPKTEVAKGRRKRQISHNMFCEWKCSSIKIEC